MTILLIELETKGHHVSSYLRSIVLDLINKKKKIILLTSRDIKKNVYFSFFKKHTKLIFINKINYPIKNNFFSLIAFQFNNYKVIKKNYDQLVVYSFDTVSTEINLNGIYEKELLFFLRAY